MSLRHSLTALVAVLGVGVLVSSSAHAQEAAGGQGAPGQGGGRRAGQGGGRRMFQPPAATAFKAVSPTAEQEAKYKTLEDKWRTDLMGLRDLEPQDRRAKMQDISKKFSDDVEALLTAEQKPKYQEELKKAQEEQRSRFGQGGGPGGPGGARGGNLMSALLPLNLTADQKTKVEPMVKDAQDQLVKIRDDQSAEPAVKREKATKVVDDLKAKIKPILNADQQKQLDTIEFLRGGSRPGGPGPAGGTR